MKTKYLFLLVTLIFGTLSFSSCKKDDKIIEKYAKDIIGKWQLDKINYTYTNHQGQDLQSEDQIVSQAGSGTTYPYFVYWDFREDGSMHNTFNRGHLESIDYSPQGWVASKDVLKMIAPQSLRYDLKIQTLNESQLVLVNNNLSNLDSLYVNGQSVGVKKSQIYTFSKP